jgi:DNA-binding NtrC family response regulator
MIKVLVVDDEVSVCQSLVGFLEDSDFDVTSASSGEEALEIAIKNVFDVAIVDLRLPGISGEALILKAYVQVPDLRFIIHTGSVGYRLSEELKKIGMIPSLVYLKPMDDLNKLVEGIKDLAKKK